RVLLLRTIRPWVRSMTSWARPIARPAILSKRAIWRKTHSNGASMLKRSPGCIKNKKTTPTRPFGSASIILETIRPRISIFSTGDWPTTRPENIRWPTASSGCIAEYPDQCFGYYWKARSSAAIDTAMTAGIAIPSYLKIIDIDGKDSTNKLNRKHLIEAYGYIAAYKANTQKDYTGSIDYFERLLALDPGNQDAARYVAILKKNLARKAAAAESHKAASTAGTDAKSEGGK